ncbi:MAG: hypothetical protein ACE5MI_03565 [Acidimicrobiia bacterium]
MTAAELIQYLSQFDGSIEVTLATTPGESLVLHGHTAVLERDGGELSEPGEVRLLAGAAWSDVDLDHIDWVRTD